MDLTAGLTKLNAHLPLAERQAALPDQLRSLHRSILSWFASHGTAPTAADLELDDDTFARGVGHLAQRDLVVIDAGGRIAGAYPFTIEDTVHLVSIDGASVHAMCSLDALAMAPMFGRKTVTTSICAVTGDPIRVEMEGDTILSAEPSTVHVGIGFQETHGCAATSLCRDMVFLRDEEAARTWQGDAGDSAPVFDLNAAVELGHRFFGPLV